MEEQGSSVQEVLRLRYQWAAPVRTSGEPPAGNWFLQGCPDVSVTV